MGWGMALGSTVGNVIDWFAGNGGYMRLTHCMNHDTLWIAITVALDLAVAAGYGLIALHWWKNGRHLPPTPGQDGAGGHAEHLPVLRHLRLRLHPRSRWSGRPGGCTTCSWRRWPGSPGGTRCGPAT